MQCTMGIDLGSTSIKAEIYDTHGNFISGGSTRTQVTEQKSANQPSRFVWDPKIIWDSVVTVIRQALAGLPGDAAVVAVATTGFGFDGVPVDIAGNPLYPFISWHCNRTQGIFEEVAARIGERRIFDKIGKPAMFYDAIYRLEWLKRYEPESLKSMHKWLFIEDYINFRLSGEMATDYTMGDCTSLLRPDTFEYDSELLAETGIEKSWLPDAYRSGKILGQVTSSASRETGFSPDTKIVLGGHDYDCASFAVGAISPGIIMDVTGTWEMLCTASSELKISEELFQSGMYVDNHVVDDSYIYMGAQVSGDMTEWFKNNLSGEELLLQETTGSNVWEALMAKAESSPVGANGCLFMPFFSGSMCPVKDKKALGSYLGLSNINTKGDMIRGLYEGLNYSFRHSVESLQSAANARDSQIVATGGATRNGFWMQNKCDVTGLTLTVPEIHEATTLGAAMLAALGAGIYKNKYEAVEAVRKSGKIFEPDLKKTEKYTEYFEELYKPAIHDLRNINHRIYDKFKKVI